MLSSNHTYQEFLQGKLQEIKFSKNEKELENMWRYIDYKYAISLLFSLEHEISIAHEISILLKFSIMSPEERRYTEKLKKALESGIVILGFNRKGNWKDDINNSISLARQCLFEMGSITKPDELDSFISKQAIILDRAFISTLYHVCIVFIREICDSYSSPFSLEGKSHAIANEDAAYAIVKFGNMILGSPCADPGITSEISILMANIAIEEIYGKLEFGQLTEGQTTQVANCFSGLGRAYAQRAYVMENFVAAERYYSTALELYNKYPKNLLRDIASTSYDLAITYDRQNRPDMVIATCSKAINILLSKAASNWRTNVKDMKILLQLHICIAQVVKEEIEYDSKGFDIQKCIDFLEEAKQVFKNISGEVEISVKLYTSLSMLYNKKTQGDRIEAVRLAISNAKEARVKYENLPKELQKWPEPNFFLANALVNLEEGDLSENLSQAICIYEKLLEMYANLIPAFYKVQILHNLADAYNSSKLMRNKLDNLLKAASRMYELLDITRSHGSRMHLSLDQKATSQNTLGYILLQQAIEYETLGRGDEKKSSRQLTKGIKHFRSGLKILGNEGYFQLRAAISVNLTYAYLISKKKSHFKESVKCGQEAINLHRQAQISGYPLAHAYNNLARAYKSQGDLLSSIPLFREALQIFLPKSFPKDCHKVSYTLATVCESLGDWQEAKGAYEKAIDSLELLYRWSTTLNSKSTQISSAGDTYLRAAYAYARTGEPKQAIIILEQGRARGLSETLDRDRTNLDNLKIQNKTLLYTRYKDITNQLRNLDAQQRDRMVSTDRHSFTPESVRNTAKELQSKWEETIDEIRKVPDYENFLTPIEWEDIEIALRSDNPLLYLVTTPNGSVTLVVTPDHIEAIWSDFTETQLRELVQTWLDAQNAKTDRTTWHNTIDTTTSQLWDLLMGPIVKKLKAKGFDRVTLIPTGYLSLLPLHAAWTPDLTTTKPTGKCYALDDIHFTYTPNAKSLTEARAIADRVKADSILAIDEPKHRYLDSDTHAFKPINSLPSSSREVAKAIATFPNSNSKILRHVEATRQAVLDALPSINVLHCSCHGNVNFQEPLKSGLSMTGDGEEAILTLRDFLGLKLTDGDRGGIRLAILSACETGLPGLDNIDEVASLPVGLLQAGVAGVISSLWSVPELSTMLLLTKFYDLWRKEYPDSPDQALREAQQWLRDSPPKSMIDHCSEFIPEVASPQKTKADKALCYALRLDYSNPYHWAAFSYTGI
jgi:CHAT domain-containing protein